LLAGSRSKAVANHVKVLLVHNYYGSSAPSGENQVFELERDLLVRHGHDVRVFVRYSDEIRRRSVIGVVQGAAATPWNPWMAKAIRRVVEEFRPDIVHAHNTFPLISPAIFPAIDGRVARVLTLHNYRLFCSAALATRDGRPCIECLERRSVLPALRYGCYRGSRMATLPLAINVGLARVLSLWEQHVEAFVALTPFQKSLVVSAGLPAERVHVKANFYPGNPSVVPWADRCNRVVYAGRLSQEKGVANLVDAWAAWGAEAPPLRIIGDGPLRRELEHRASTSGRISFVGQLPAIEAQAEIANARLVVLPSLWFEGFPLVLREAFAFGTPVAVSDLGPLPALVDEGRAGFVFRSGDAHALLRAVRRAWSDPAALERQAAAARRVFEQRYAEETNYPELMRIYGSAMDAQRARRTT
jgi:glycosyltransferase involved in cell wall biosynthesis